MLAALIATCGDGAAPADPARRGPVERTGAVRGARRLRAGKVLLPAAACLVLLAGVGALAYQGLVAAQLNGSLQGAAGSGTASSSGSLPASRTARLPKTSARRPTEPRTAHPRQAETTAPRARPRPAALQRRPPPTVRSTRALPATAPAPARAARSSRSPPGQVLTHRNRRGGTAPRRQPGPRGRRDRAGDRLRRRRRACRDLHGFRLGERRASLRRALSGRRRLLLGRRSRVARASAPGAARSHRAESPRRTGIPDRVKGSKRERERP